MKKNEVDILGGRIWSNMIRYTIPIILTGVLQLLYNAADVIVVGRYAGRTSLAAVGSTSSISNLLFTFFLCLSAGTSYVVARYTGSGNDEALSRSVHTSVAISVIGGVILAVIGYFFSYPLLSLMNTPADIIDEAALYMKIIFIGMPVSLLYNFGAAIIRTYGDTKTPLIYLSVSGLVNVFLNLLFVIVFKMKAEGVGTATILSQVLSAFLITRFLIKTDKKIKLYPSKISIDPAILKTILMIGIPAGLQGMLFSISNVLIQSSVNSFGSQAVAGNSAASNIEGFCYIAMNAMQTTLLTFVAQNLSAENFNRLKKIVLTGLFQVTVIGILFSAVLLYFARPLLSLYAPNDPEVIKYGLIRMNIILMSYFICGIMDSAVGILRGMGRSFVPMLVSVVGVCGIRIIWIFTVFKRIHTLKSLYMSYPISWTLTAMIHLICCFIILRGILKAHQNEG